MDKSARQDNTKEKPKFPLLINIQFFIYDHYLKYETMILRGHFFFGCSVTRVG